jgi:hypothetical protein
VFAPATRMRCPIMPGSQPLLGSIARDTPVRFSVAAALAFPDGSMSASGLRGKVRSLFRARLWVRS